MAFVNSRKLARRHPHPSTETVPAPCSSCAATGKSPVGMVLAFSVGLATVLVGLGLLLVTATPVLSRCTGHRFRWVSARLPLLSAIVVAILGVVMTVSGLSSLTT